jgi:membrane associated rhomboid family serine protease
VRGSVGSLCPGCRRASRAPLTTRLRYWQAAHAAIVTRSLIIANLAVFVSVALADARSLSGRTTRLQVDLGLAADLVALGPTEWYRVVTSGFVHFGLIHVGFNMFLLHQLGGMLEPAIGRIRFALVYVICLVGGSAGAMLLQPNALHGGASGAVFGLMGLAAVGYQQRGINPLNTSIGTLLLLNLAITFVVPGISIGGHLGGAVAGALCGYVVLSPGRRSANIAMTTSVLVALGILLVAITIVASG